MNSLFPEDICQNQNKIRNTLTESISKWYDGVASHQNKLENDDSYFLEIESQRFISDIFNDNIVLKNRLLANL